MGAWSVGADAGLASRALGLQWWQDVTPSGGPAWAVGFIFNQSFSPGEASWKVLERHIVLLMWPALSRHLVVADLPQALWGTPACRFI